MQWSFYKGTSYTDDISLRLLWNLLLYLNQASSFMMSVELKNTCFLCAFPVFADRGFMFGKLGHNVSSIAAMKLTSFLSPSLLCLPLLLSQIMSKFSLRSRCWNFLKHGTFCSFRATGNIYKLKKQCAPIKSMTSPQSKFSWKIWWSSNVAFFLLAIVGHKYYHTLLFLCQLQKFRKTSDVLMLDLIATLWFHGHIYRAS